MFVISFPVLQIINILSISIYDNWLNCINPAIMFIEQRGRSRSLWM